MASARAAGGLHTLRNIEAGLQAQLSDHRADLQSLVQHSARGSEESAVQRAEALLGPPVESVKERLDREIPTLQRAIEAAAGEARHEARALRADLTAETAQLRDELRTLRDQLPELGARLHRGEEAVAELRGLHRDLWTATESVRACVNEASSALTARMAEVAERTAGAVEKRWCVPIQERLSAAEAALKEVDLRARHDSSAAMDAAKMVQDALQCRVEELRLEASRESRRHAAEVAAGLREEVLGGEILQRFQQRLHESTLCWESRIADVRAQLADRIESAGAEALANAEQRSQERLAKLAGDMAEAMEATRRELAAQGQSHAAAAKDWCRQLQDAKTGFDAADALSRSSVEGLRERLGRLADDAAELREGLGQTRRAAHDDASAVRAELRERALQWRAFEEVGLPTLLAHVEQRAGEGEGRSVRAALEYAERLRRLPAAAATAAAPPVATAPSTPLAGRTRLLDTATAELPGPSPLPPLTPASARRPRAVH